METRPHIVTADDIVANPLLADLGAQEGTTLTLSGPAKAADAAPEEGAEKPAEEAADAGSADASQQQ